jgi:hypothetical protein
MSRMHFHLRKYRTSEGEKYTISSDDSQPELEVLHFEGDDGSEFCFENGPVTIHKATVYLTAGVLISFLRQQARGRTTMDALGLCEDALRCTGPLAAYETSKIERLPKPKDYCTNDLCWNRNPPKQIDIPRCGDFEPWVPWVIRDPQSYSVTSGPIFASVPQGDFDDNSDTYTLVSSCTSMRCWSLPSSSSTRDDDLVIENMSMSVPIWGC